MEAVTAQGSSHKSLNSNTNQIAAGATAHPPPRTTNGVRKNNYVNEFQPPPETIYNFKGPIPLATRPSHEVKIKKNKNHRRTKTIMQQKVAGMEKHRYSMIHTPMNILDPTFQQQQHSFGQPSPLHKSQSSKEFFKNSIKQQHQHLNFYQVPHPPSQALIGEAYQPLSRKQIQRDPLKNNLVGGTGAIRTFTKNGDEIFYYTAQDQVPTFPYGPRLSWHSYSPPRDFLVLDQHIQNHQQQQFTQNESVNGYQLIAQGHQSKGSNYQPSQINLQQQKGGDLSMPIQRFIHQQAGINNENDQQTIQSIVRDIVREEVSRAITSPTQKRNHSDNRQSLSANRLGSMRVLSPEFSVGGQTERDQVEQLEQAEMHLSQMKQNNASHQNQGTKEMSYVIGVSNASDAAGNSPIGHKKRPSKVIIIKKDEIMKPFQEISPITTPKRKEIQIKDGDLMFPSQNAILASGIRQSKAEFTQQKQLEIAKVDNALQKGQENKKESSKSPVLLPPQVQEFMNSLSKSDFIKPLLGMIDGKFLNIQIPLIDQSPAQTIFNQLKQILIEMKLLFPSLKHTQEVSCATEPIQKCDKHCGNEQLEQQKDNSAQCPEVLLIDADLSAIIIEKKKEERGTQTDGQSNKEQQVQTQLLSHTNETQTNVEKCDQDVQMTKRCSKEEGAQTEIAKGQDQAIQYELSYNQDQCQAAAIVETFQVEEIIRIKIDQVVQTEKIITPKVVKVIKKRENNKNYHHQRKESSSLESRIELVDGESSSRINQESDVNGRKILKKNFSFMSSTIDPRNQNAIDNIRNILRNSTEQKAGLHLDTDHNEERDGSATLQIDYAAKRLSRKILHNRNQSMGGTAMDFKKQLLQVHLKKVSLRKQERDQLQSQINYEKNLQEEVLLKTLDKEQQEKMMQQKNALKGKEQIKLKNALNDESDNSYYHKKCFQQSDLDDVLIETERGLQEISSQRGTGRKHIENIFNKISSKSTQALISKQ